jgi:hypothetical protein
MNGRVASATCRSSLSSGQEDFFDPVDCAVLHQCIRPLIGAFELRAIMDISARAISLANRPRTAILVTSIRQLPRRL